MTPTCNCTNLFLCELLADTVVIGPRGFLLGPAERGDRYRTSTQKQHGSSFPAIPHPGRTSVLGFREAGFESLHPHALRSQPPLQSSHHRRRDPRLRASNPAGYRVAPYDPEGKELAVRSHDSPRTQCGLGCHGRQSLRGTVASGPGIPLIATMRALERGSASPTTTTSSMKMYVHAEIPLKRIWTLAVQKYEE